MNAGQLDRSELRAEIANWAFTGKRITEPPIPFGAAELSRKFFVPEGNKGAQIRSTPHAARVATEIFHTVSGKMRLPCTGRPLEGVARRGSRDRCPPRDRSRITTRDLFQNSIEPDELRAPWRLIQGIKTPWKYSCYIRFRRLKSTRGWVLNWDRGSIGFQRWGNRFRGLSLEMAGNWQRHIVFWGFQGSLWKAEVPRRVDFVVGGIQGELIRIPSWNDLPPKLTKYGPGPRADNEVPLYHYWKRVVMIHFS